MVPRFHERPVKTRGKRREDSDAHRGSMPAQARLNHGGTESRRSILRVSVPSARRPPLSREGRRGDPSGGSAPPGHCPAPGAVYWRRPYPVPSVRPSSVRPLTGAGWGRRGGVPKGRHRRTRGVAPLTEYRCAKRTPQSPGLRRCRRSLACKQWDRQASIRTLEEPAGLGLGA